MGFYWTTYLYQGKIVDVNDVNDVNELKYNDCNKMVISKKHIMFYDRRIVMASIDSILREPETIQKYVLKDELDRWLSLYVDKKEEWDRTDKLTTNNEFSLFIAQVGWDTYGDDCYLEYNLPVISNISV